MKTQERLIVDYSQTINCFTMLDAYPLPRIDDTAIILLSTEEGETRPDPEHMHPLGELPVPSDRKGLNQLLGFFSYYSQWIRCFFEKIRPLATASSFPISEEAKTAFEILKRDIEESVVCAID